MTSKSGSKTGKRNSQQTGTGPWDAALDKVREWDPQWAEACLKMSANPWNSGVLPLRLVELISIAVHAACTNQNPEGTRRHIRAALAAGATRDEILMVLKCAAVMSLHSCSLGIPILVEEAKAAGVAPAPRTDKPATPAVDKMRALGQWNAAWDPFYELDPAWTDQFMAAGVGIYASGVLAQGRRALVDRLRRLVHAHVRPRHAPPHQGGTGGWRDDGGGHGGTEALRRPGRSGLQPRRADPGRGTGQAFGQIG